MSHPRPTHERMRPRPRLVALLLTGLLLLLVPFAAAQTELRIGIAGEGDTMDPGQLSLVTSFAVATNIYSGLVRYTPGTLDLQPDLATSWEVSDDGLVWTFHLRGDVQWQKGYGDLTAEDVVASFERARSPDSGSRWSGELAMVDTISAPDPATVVFTLNTASAAFLHTVAAFRQGLIVNVEAAAEYGDDYGRNPVGSGAYQLREWNPGVEIVLEANPDYYEGVPAIDVVRFIIIADENVRMLALQNGELDIAMSLTNPELYQRILANPALETGEITTSTMHGIMLNTRQAPFDDVRVRQAVLHAIDRDIIAEVIWGGLAEPAYSELAPAYLGHSADVPRYDYDPERAKALLAEAGHPNGFRTTFTYLSTHNQELLAVLRANLRDVGIELDIDMADGGTWVQKLGSGQVPMVLALATRADPHIWYSNFFHSDAFTPGLNGMWYDAVDELIDAGNATADPQERAAIYAQVSQQIMSDVPFIPLYWPMHAHPYWSYVEGWNGRQQYDAWLFPVSLNR